MSKPIDHGARAHAALPPSSSDKWLYCYGWLKTMNELRANGFKDTSSAAAEEGTNAHERMEDILQTFSQISTGAEKTPPSGVAFGDHEHDDDLEPMLEWIRDQPGEMHSEIRLDFGKAFGYEGLGGTVDILFDEPHRLTLPDLKFGRGIVEVTRNPQLMTYLSGAVDEFGPRAEYRLVILQPRAWHADGPIREYTVSHDELMLFRFDLENAIEANLAGEDCTPGNHCRKFCNALGTCRAASIHARKRLADFPPEDE